MKRDMTKKSQFFFMEKGKTIKKRITTKKTKTNPIIKD